MMNMIYCISIHPHRKFRVMDKYRKKMVILYRENTKMAIRLYIKVAKERSSRRNPDLLPRFVLWKQRKRQLLLSMK